MTPVTFAKYVRFRTRTTSSTLPDDELSMLMNVHKDNIAERILKVNEDYFGVPETADLHVGQREYTLPADMLTQMKRLEAYLGGKWVRLEELELSEYKGVTDEATIISRFSNEEGNAFYDIFRESLFLYTGTIAAVDEGLKLWAFSYPHDITPEQMTETIDLSQDPSPTEHGFPRAFHKLWATACVIDYKSSRAKPIPLTDHELTYERDLVAKLNDVTNRNQDRVTTASIPTGTKRWNEGFNL